jgi:hypothetical protein
MILPPGKLSFLRPAQTFIPEGSIQATTPGRDLQQPPCQARPTREFGFATLVNSRWLTYVACAALYAIIFDVIPRFVLKSEVGLMSVGTRNQIIFSFFAAPGLLHYWIDGHIWKVRSDPGLRTYLQLDRA